MQSAVLRMFWRFTLVLILTFPLGKLCAAPLLLGDVNADGQISVLDITRLQLHLSGANPFIPQEQLYADANQDGLVTDADIGAIADIIMGLQLAQALPPLGILSASPSAGEGNVSLTRETIFRFTQPLSSTNVINTNTLYATFGGRRILSRVELANDKRGLTLFYLEPLPSSARIHVTLNAPSLTGLLGTQLDGNGDGLPGGMGTLDFDTASITPIPNTAVIGTVYASELAASTNGLTNTVNVPLAGVVITVDGAEQTLRTVTSSNGTFVLSPCPSGRFFVHVDGRTVTNLAAGIRYPDKAYYPFVGKAWEAVPGIMTNLANGNGLIYLPLITTGTLQTVSMVTNTVITFPSSVIASNPALAGVSIDVPAGALYNDNGTRGGKLGIAPVSPDRLPEPLPPGLNFPLVITVQSDGPSNFGQPIPVRFPNLPDPVTGIKLPPGAKTALWSFDHDTGRWEIQGSMTVTADGNFVESDPGVGIKQPGWHGVQQGRQISLPPQFFVSPTNSHPSNSIFADTEIKIRTFIPSPAVVFDVPVIGFAYAGDGRGFSYSSGTSRTHQELVVNVSEENPIVSPLIRNSSPTIEYKLEDTISLEDKPSWYRNLKSNPTIQDQTVAQHNDRNSYVNVFSLGKNTISVQFVIDIHNELQLFAPHLDYEITFVLVGDDDGDVSYTIFGKHDGFPAYEIYLNGQLVYSHDPIATGNAPVALGPPMEIPVLKGGVVQQSKGANRIKKFEVNGVSIPMIPLTSGEYYYVVENMLTGVVVHRGQASVSQSKNFIITSDDAQRYQIKIYAPKEGKYANVLFDAGTAGQLTKADPIVLGRLPHIDMDDDELSEFAESILGTDPSNPDTDGDAIPDGVEIQQGTNPLDGRPVATGVIAAVNTPGDAVDVAVDSGVAVVADSAAGVAIFNAINSLNPTRAAQIPTPAPATKVACTGNSVIAGCGSTLVIIDISNLSSVFIRNNVPLGSQINTLAADGGIGYAGLADGNVVVVDLGTGLVLNRFTVGAAVEDISLAGDEVYVLAGTLRIYRAQTDSYQLLGSATVAGSIPPLETGRCLFVGGGYAYIGTFTGYRVYAVTNPATPVLVGSPLTTQLAAHSIAVNGSGLMVSVTSFSGTGSLDVSLYDSSAPGDVTRFLTSFGVPGVPRAVAVNNGLAYVATQDGLKIVNYRAYDALHVAPNIELKGNFAQTSPTNGVIEEGQPVRLTATCSDDVQVRNVGFYINGQLANTDVAFPFEYRFIAPVRSSGITNFVVRAKATDTGGNTNWSATINVAITPDITPPRFSRQYPTTNAVADVTNVAVFVFFSEPINTNTLTATNFSVTWAGPDSKLNTGDDALVTTATLSARDTLNAAVVSFAGTPSNGLYRATISTNVSDMAGNRPTNSITWTFWLLRGGASGDADSDGLTNTFEIAASFNPINGDTDVDGWDDGVEFVEGAGYVTNLILRPRIIFVSKPPVSTALPGSDELGLTGKAILVATPPVQVNLFGSDENGSVGTGIFLARPWVSVALPGADENGTVGVPVFIAKPPVNIAVTGADETGMVGTGVFFARPAIAVQLPGPDETGNVGTRVIVAKPPIKVNSP